MIASADAQSIYDKDVVTAPEQIFEEERVFKWNVHATEFVTMVSPMIEQDESAPFGPSAQFSEHVVDEMDDLAEDASQSNELMHSVKEDAPQETLDELISRIALSAAGRAVAEQSEHIDRMASEYANQSFTNFLEHIDGMASESSQKPAKDQKMKKNNVKKEKEICASWSASS